MESISHAIKPKLHNETDMIEVGECTLRDLEASANWIYLKSVCMHSTSASLSNSQKIIIYKVLNVSGYNINSFFCV